MYYSSQQQTDIMNRLEQGIGYYGEKVVNGLKNGAVLENDDNTFKILSLWYSTLIYSPTTITDAQRGDLLQKADLIVGDFPGNAVITQDIVLP